MARNKNSSITTGLQRRVAARSCFGIGKALETKDDLGFIIHLMHQGGDERSEGPVS